MGIKDLYTLIKNKAPNSYHQLTLNDLRGCTAALDGNTFLYRFLYFYGDDQKALSQALIDVVEFLQINQVRPIVVFDGVGFVVEKERTLEARKQRRVNSRKRIDEIEQVVQGLQQVKEQMQTTLDPARAEDKQTAPMVKSEQQDQTVATQLDKLMESVLDTKPTQVVEQKETQDDYDSDDETELEVTPPPAKKQKTESEVRIGRVDECIVAQQTKCASLKKQTHKVSSQNIELVIKELAARNVLYIRASAESDFIFAHLAKRKIIDCVFGDDGDFLVFGVTRVIRNLCKHKAHTGEPLVEYRLDEVLSGLGLTHAAFTDMSILMQCDYASKIQNVGTAKAYAGIRKHKTVERFLASLPKSKTRVVDRFGGGEDVDVAAAVAADDGSNEKPTKTKKRTKDFVYESDFLSQVQRARALFDNPPLSDSDRQQIESLAQFLTMVPKLGEAAKSETEATTMKQ